MSQHAAAFLLATLLIPCASCSTVGDPSSGAGTPGTGSDRPDVDSVEGLPTIDEHTTGMRRLDGFLPLHWDAAQGRLHVEVPAEDQDILYVVSLPGGLGSNDVGLDRGQLGARHLVRFRRLGRRVLLIAPNLAWRTSSTSEVERAGVRDSFAESVLFGFEVEASQGERVLFDGTEFFLRDAHGIQRKLAGSGQGSFRLEASRSALDPDRLRSFPENTEVEALLTFTSDEPGPEVRSTAPAPEAVTLRLRHSFIALAPEGENDYAARRFDPRGGYYPHTWRDVGAPIDQPLEERVLVRHHLTADDPIVYHVDRAAPEPIRSALVEGARYWCPVFEAAGFPDGFQVELLPEGADPQDVRFNVIQWVNRSTRGWSYGDALTDPRTGEILKGHVSLGALRVRQDVLILRGLLAGQEDADARAVEVALDRIRQLSAHEVGHTLGLTHNFAASADGRESVMDYPAPRVSAREDGTIDVADAYRDGCGAWDELAIRFGYGDFESGDEEAEGLADVLRTMRTRGLSFLGDADARGTGRAHPAANLWDDGEDSLEALRGAYAVRALALVRLSGEALPPDRPLADLEELLVPLYLHHRFQLEAAARLLGGRWYAYSVAGDPDAGLRTVEVERQNEALELVLEALEPDFLRLPPELATLLLPPPPGHRRDRESFEPGARLFDSLAPVRAGAELALRLLLHPERAARLVEQARLDPRQPSLQRVLDLLIELTARRAGDAQVEAVRYEIQNAFLAELMRLATNEGADDAVRSRAWGGLRFLHNPDRPKLDQWQLDALWRFLEDPNEFPPPARSRIPPGSPIGCGVAPWNQP